MYKTVFSNDLMHSTELRSKMIVCRAQNTVLKFSYAQVHRYRMFSQMISRIRTEL